MGIVEPQRRILRQICPGPLPRDGAARRHDNYCCGGGSGFAIMDGPNFADWRNSGRLAKKLEQILDAFQDGLDPAINKYYCAPCSNCKGTARENLIKAYQFKRRYNITCGGLSELMVNALGDLPQPFITWESDF